MNVVNIVHVAAGTLSLGSLTVAVVARKGSRSHRLGGQLFTAGMSLTIATGVIVCIGRLLDHRPENDGGALFLLHVALLTAAGLAHGRAAIRDKGPRRAARFVLPGLLILSSLGIASLALSPLKALWIVFAALGLALAASQIAYWWRPATSPKARLAAHLSGMGTAAIGAVTAFTVVNSARLLPGLPLIVAWTLPGVLGGIWLTLAQRRLANRDRAAAPGGLP